jgi:hypothetical protein
VISFDAVVYKVQTLVDGGIRVTLDLPEHAIGAAAELMRYKRDEVPLRVACSGGFDETKRNVPRSQSEADSSA